MRSFKLWHQEPKEKVAGVGAFFNSIACIEFVLIFLAVGVHAQTYSAVSGFSLKTNTHASRWSYRYNTTGTRDGNYKLLPYVEPSGNQWHDQGKKIVVLGWWPQPSDTYVHAFSQTSVPRQ